MVKDVRKTDNFLSLVITIADGAAGKLSKYLRKSPQITS